MSTRINIKLFFVLFLLIGSFGFVSPQETSEEVDIGSLLGLEEGNVFGTDLDVSDEGVISFLSEESKLVLNKGEENEIILEGQGIEVSDLREINFVSENSKAVIDGNVFENIVPVDGTKHPVGKNPSFINLDPLTGKIESCDFLVNENGGDYIINGVSFKTPSGSESLVSYNSLEKGALRLVGGPDNIVLNEVNEPVLISGYFVEVEEGYVLENGVLEFDGEGGIFMYGGDEAKINGLNIENNGPSHLKTNLFFDGGVHEGNHISFGEEKFTYSNGGDAFSSELIFEEGNPYVEIEEGDHVSFRGDSFSLENRDSEELVPKLTIHEGSSFYSNNDGKLLNFNDGKIKIDPSSYTPELLKTTSSPVEIAFESDSNEKILFDNFNRFAIVPEGFDTERYWDEFEGIFVEFSSNLKYNYVEEDNLQKIIGTEIDFGEGLEEIPEGKRQLALGRIRDYWEILSPETKESVGKITISDDAFEGFEENEIAYEKEGKLFFRSLESSINLETFRHESAHAWHHSIKKTPEIRGFLDQIDGLMDELEAAPSEQARREVRSRIIDLENKILSRRLSGDEFTNSWKDIAGPYNEAVKVKGVGSFYKDSITETEYIVDESPRYGYIRPYGGTSPNEDIATFFEEIRNPEFFKPLLSKENEWHEIYRAKLDLIYEYGGITEREYFDILEAVEE